MCCDAHMTMMVSRKREVAGGAVTELLLLLQHSPVGDRVEMDCRWAVGSGQHTERLAAVEGAGGLLDPLGAGAGVRWGAHPEGPECARSGVGECQGGVGEWPLYVLWRPNAVMDGELQYTPFGSQEQLGAAVGF